MDAKTTPNRSIALVLTMIFACSFEADTLASEMRYDAMLALEEKGFDTSFDNLSSTLQNEDADLRTRLLAALALGQSGNPQALDVLLAELNNSNMKIRGGVLRGISETRDSRAIPALESVLLSDGSPAVRQASLSALAKTGTGEAISAIARGLSVANQNTGVRISIVEFLRSNPSFDSRGLLESLLLDENWEIRARAAVALSERGQLKSDQVLVDVATSYDIPHYVWTDVVSRLEDAHNTTFFSEGPSGRSRMDMNFKQRVNAEILDWWSNKNSIEQQ
ncbi:MAG: HEAT repeat domain-containing protein [Pseudomonadota bacterium]